MTTFEDGNVTQTLEDHRKSRLNWNNLPPEMKLLCIKEMDFKARMGLRCLSKTERRLVDSLGKYKFDEVTFILFPCDECESGIHFPVIRIELIADSGRDEFLNEMWVKSKMPDEPNIQKFVGLLHQVLACDITRFSPAFSEIDPQEPIIAAIANLPVLSVKQLDVLQDSTKLTIQILKRCDENNLIDIEISDLDNLEEDLFDMPQVFNAKRLCLGDEAGSQVHKNTFKMAMKWLEMNRNRPEAGKVLKVWCFSDPIPKIIEELGDSIIHCDPTEQAARVTTSDPSLHIWIHGFPGDGLFWMTIVPSDSEDPEIPIDGR